MLDVLRKFEQVILVALVLMMSIVVFLSTIELGWIILRDIVTPPFVLLENYKDQGVSVEREVQKCYLFGFLKCGMWD